MERSLLRLQNWSIWATGHAPALQEEPLLTLGKEEGVWVRSGPSHHSYEHQESSESQVKVWFVYLLYSFQQHAGQGLGSLCVQGAAAEWRESVPSAVLEDPQLLWQQSGTVLPKSTGNRLRRDWGLCFYHGHKGWLGPHLLHSPRGS